MSTNLPLTFSVDPNQRQAPFGDSHGYDKRPVCDELRTLLKSDHILNGDLLGCPGEENRKIFWEGTEHWDELLIKRAEMSGKLVLSEFTRNALAGYAKA